ncbi:DUF6288 domain-containing protein [Akkermansiaceae bacterium]|nr:DUF6288 domain-containing protein [Akkermansiaceae bacterium]
MHILTTRKFRIHSLPSLLALSACVFISAPLTLRAQSDKIIPADIDTKDISLISLGPIGVRVKTDHQSGRVPRSESNSGIVMFTFENSPAENVLELGDEIVGINGKKFNKNFTALIAEEINLAEGSNGKLKLEILRDSKPRFVTLDIEPIGSYAPTWPKNCKKSQVILENACDWLVKHQHKNGRIEKNEGNACLVLTSASGLAMLGCDEKKYSRPVKKIASFLIEHIEQKTNKDGHFNGGTLDLWSINYAAIFLSEYYLRTDDKKAFKTLEFLNDEIYYRQFHQMSPEAAKHITTHLVNVKKYKHDPVPKYWFGHGLITTKANGYVHLGVNVANATVAWSLMDKVGVEVDRENLKATLDYIEKACVSGAMGYSSKMNQNRIHMDAFGRTGLLGISLAMEEGRENYKKKVTNALNLISANGFYSSHATCVMGKAWGALGMAQLDPNHFRKVMDEMQGDFDLLRLSDGSFVSNPVKNNIHGKYDLLTGGSGERHRWTTAFNALIYTIGEGKLMITGG